MIASLNNNAQVHTYHRVLVFAVLDIVLKLSGQPSRWSRISEKVMKNLWEAAIKTTDPPAELVKPTNADLFELEAIAGWQHSLGSLDRERGDITRPGKCLRGICAGGICSKDSTQWKSSSLSQMQMFRVIEACASRFPGHRVIPLVSAELARSISVPVYTLPTLRGWTSNYTFADN